jgi:molybdenum cofactor cytidylyltransferase
MKMPKVIIKPNSTSALILAAGNSSRMGSPKFILKFDETSTFVEKIVGEYANFGCREIILVLNADGMEALKNLDCTWPDNLKPVLNKHPEFDRFFSIKTGIESMNKPERVFVHHADNPFVFIDLLESMLSMAGHSDYQIPCYKGKGGHPILISGKIIQQVVFQSENIFNVRIFLQRFSKIYIECIHPEILWNINTPDDYLKFLFMTKNR